VKLTEVRKDHDEVRSMISKLKVDIDKDQKQRLFNDLVKKVAQHNVAEEVVLYPAVREIISESLFRTATDQTIEEEKVLYDLDQRYGRNISAPGFTENLSKFETVMELHIKMEEEEILPILESTCNADDIDSINHWFDNTRNLAPSRPHPDGPHSAAANLASGPILKFIDKLRDLSKKMGSQLK